MTGMTINEFMDKVYYGDEIEFKLSNKTYFVQGNFINNKYQITVDYWTKEDGTESPHDYLLNSFCSSPQERVNIFKEAKIFDGKRFCDVTNDIKVIWG